MANTIKLLTGIPRSGTTLCCKLLNQHKHVVALHEPIDPAELTIGNQTNQTVTQITEQIKSLSLAIEHGLPFNHGDKGGLKIDNPVGLDTKLGVRQVVAKRGQIQLPARKSGSYKLVVKQNALFTALLPELSKLYPIVCIVRNPVDVLLSWLTVDLPVNRGHIPAGERFDVALKAKLQEPDCLKRQLIIYQWFVDAFLTSGLPIVRYEDIISSNGTALDHAMALTPIKREVLNKQKRKFDDKVINSLKKAKNKLLTLNCAELYTNEEIVKAMHIYGV